MKNNLPNINIKDWLDNFEMTGDDNFKIIRYHNYGKDKTNRIEIILTNREGVWTINWPAMGERNTEDTYLFAQVLQKGVEVAEKLNNKNN